MAARIDQSYYQSPPAVSPEEVEQVLKQLLRSKYFSHAPKKQKFIRLVCEYYLAGRAGDLNEYLLGREVFGRDDRYSPATDPIVRVGAHDVRRKLEQYYQNEGAADAIRLIIPVGSYEPFFVRTTEINRPNEESSNEAQKKDDIQAVAATVITSEIEVSGSRTLRNWLWGTSVLAVLLLLAAIGLFTSRQNLRRQLAGITNNADTGQSQQTAVWEPFLSNNIPTLLILSNPSVHRPANLADPEVLTSKGINLTPSQASALTNETGDRLPVDSNNPMRLVPAPYMYTGIGEAIGVYRLAGLMNTLGERTVLKQSRSIGPEDLKQYDIILLGSVYSNQWSKPLAIRENFVYSRNATIENLMPHEGEQREYKAVFDQRTGNLLEDYALITVTPGVAADRMIMILAGIYSEGTQAAVEYVTTPSTLDELNQRLLATGGQTGPPRYYQALLHVRVENSFPTKITLLTLHDLQVEKQ